MKIFLTDISDMNDDIMNKGLKLVPAYRKDKVERYRFKEDKERSLAAGLLLNYATKMYSMSMSKLVMDEPEIYGDKSKINADDQKTDVAWLRTDKISVNVHGYIECENKDNIKDDIKDKKDNIISAKLCELIKEYDHKYDYDIEYTEKGKPVYSNSDIHFNLSHAGDYVVCAVSDRAVGIDIERIRKNAIKVAERFFTQEECDWIADDNLRFCRVWTLKEAYAKLTGEGIAGVVSKVEFRHEAGNEDGYEATKETQGNIDKNEAVKNHFDPVDNMATTVNMYISGKKVDNIKIYELNIIKPEYAISAIEYLKN